MLANTVIPIEQYPPVCWTYVESEGIVAMIKRGESGYHPVGGFDNDHERGKALVAEQNATLGLRRSEIEAMTFGSMFGWDLPGADPAKYVKLDEAV